MRGFGGSVRTAALCVTAKQRRKALLVGAVTTLGAITVAVVSALRRPSWSELGRF